MLLDLFASLNEEQRQAVSHGAGPALVIAGAGSGKTRVLTHRIAHLLRQGIPASAILAVTFTNKAAAEMKHRVEALAGVQPDLWIGTFHAMCARLLRREIAALGMQPNFTILDDQDQLTVIKEALQELKIDDKIYRPNALREQIGRAKNRLLSPQQQKEQAADHAGNVLGSVYQAYQRKLFANNSMDFDDLLMASVKLLQKDAALLARYQARFQHVLIDEYQDTNHAQYTLARLLAGRHNNVFAVGDEDQSIYSFRGAEIHNILDFDRDFPDTVVYRLQQNYRSTQNILNTANALIRNNRQRKGKTLWTENGEGDRVRLYHASDEREEVDFVLDTMQGLDERGELSLKEVVMFYRVHALSRVLEEGLRRRGIPYGIVGGVGFYERREVKDALAYLRVIAGPSDSLSLKRILNVPSRGIGPSSLMALQEIAARDQGSLWSAMEGYLAGANAGKKSQQGMRQFMEVIRKARGMRDGMSISELLAWVLEESGYLPELRRDNSIEAKTRLENLKELSSATEEFEAENPGGRLEDFLADVALWTDLDRYQDEDNKVTLMSLHSSKGLEFSHVFIVGLEEGIFPYSFWGMDPNELEEERRLLYVGMTRARKRLFLSCARNRMLFGNRKSFEPSRFISEVQGAFLEVLKAEEPSYEHFYDRLDDEPARPARLAAVAASAITTDFDYQEGQAIRHPKFGEGRVLQCFDAGENLKLSVQFRAEQHPRLLAVKYANLQKTAGRA